MNTEVFAQEVKREDVDSYASSLTEESFCLDVMEMCDIVKRKASQLAELLSNYKEAIVLGGFTIKVEMADKEGVKLVESEIGVVREKDRHSNIVQFPEGGE